MLEIKDNQNEKTITNLLKELSEWKKNYLKLEESHSINNSL